MHTEPIVIDLPMSEEVPPLVDLPAGALPCRLCGCAVVGAPPTGEPIIRERRGRGMALLAQETQPLTLCAPCQARDAAAPAHLVKPLLAFDALGVRRPDLRTATEASLLTKYVTLGVAVGFDRHGDIGKCSSSPWSHLSEEFRTALRAQTATWLRATLERPVEVAIPVDSERAGCLVCGVGSVTAMPSEMWSIWRRVHASVSSLGGRGARNLNGDVCPTCASEIDDAGGLGAAALRRALLNFVGFRPTGLSGLYVEMRVLAFGALPEGTPANSSPWGHVDLRALRSDLTAADAGLIDEAAI